MKKNDLCKFLAGKVCLCATTMLTTIPVYGNNEADSLSAERRDVKLNSVLVQGGKARKSHGVVNAEMISTTELFRAACCNLGESFTTNPSVDVNYADAATGARQIKLLGLSGLYVQMLTENIPNYRGASIPYALSYVPGTWMQSIQSTLEIGEKA